MLNQQKIKLSRKESKELINKLLDSKKYQGRIKELELAVRARDDIIEYLQNKTGTRIVTKEERSMQEILKDWNLKRTSDEDLVVNSGLEGDELNMNKKILKPELIKPYVGRNSDGDLCLVMED